MAIRIGEATTYNTPEDYAVTPDDRQSLVQTLGGAVAMDNGTYVAGDKYSFTALFSPANWALVKGYWTNRTLVTIGLPDGNGLAGCRVIVKSYTIGHVLFPSHVKANIEIWRV